MPLWVRGGVVAAGVWLLASVTVHAQSEGPGEGEGELHRSPHTEETSMIFGAKATQLNAFVNAEEGEPSSEHGGGVGVFYETTLVEGWLEIEFGVSTAYLPEPDELEIPLDVLLKKPFCFGNVVQTYIAVGPTMAFAFRNGEAVVKVGGALAVGTYLWFSDNVGLDVEADYAALGEGGELVQELTFAVGFVLRL